MATLDTGNPAQTVIVDDNLALAENIAEILILEGLPSEEALPRALGAPTATR